MNVLKGVGLAFTESGLATRLAALGLVAAVDGPLPVGDFIALVTAAVIISEFAADYVTSSATSTAIANNIGIHEGVTYKAESTKSMTQTKTITFPNNYKHWAAAPNNNWGGGIFILTPLTYSQAVLRALSLQDTYSLTFADARSVAQGGSDTGYSPVHDFAHTNNSSGVYMYPNNKPHWHCIKYGGRVPGHHWYG